MSTTRTFEVTITDDYVCLDMDQTVFADETGQTIDEQLNHYIYLSDVKYTIVAPAKVVEVDNIMEIHLNIR